VHALIYATGGSPTLPIGNPGSGSETAFQISLGNPHLKTDISKYTVTLDGSQSYTRNSNVSIQKYYFDVSKISQGNTVSNTSDVTQISDVLSFAGDEYPTRKVSYSFDSSHGDQFDEHLRYFSTERLIRLQVQDNSEDTKVDSTDDITFSDLSYPYPAALTHTGFPDFIKYNGAMLYYNGGFNTGGGAPEWQTLESLNSTNNTVIFGGAKDGQNSLENPGLSSIGTAKCFLLLVQDKPFNKIFFRMDNKGADWGVSLSGTDDMQQLKTSIWYGTTDVSATSNGWRPLKFNDSTEIFKGRNGTSGPDNDGVDGVTRSLSTSGSFTFDVPLDWEKTTPYTVAETDALDNLISTVPNTGTSDHDPDDKWTFEGYALLFGFTPNLDASGNPKNALKFVNCLRNIGSEDIRLRGSQEQQKLSYFCTVTTDQCNFSTNPTLVSGSQGKLRHKSMYSNPQVYITGVGLHNADGTLMAIAKLSTPILKNFGAQHTIKVNLTY